MPIAPEVPVGRELHEHLAAIVAVLAVDAGDREAVRSVGGGEDEGVAGVKPSRHASGSEMRSCALAPTPATLRAPAPA